MAEGRAVVDFSVLGPLRVVAGNEPVYLRAGKPRLLLAILLAHAGRAVSADRLVAGVWGAQPPRSARRNLQQYVHQLRGVLTSSRIQHCDGGYAFVAAPGDTLDAAAFEGLAARAQTALDRGATAVANRLLRAALELWRGQPFADCADCVSVAEEAARLSRLHFTVLEQWAETQLALGRHRELADTWHQVVHQYPHREPMRACLMLALYRSGRPTEALEVYQQAYRQLVDDLGVEPGLELQQLHQRILTNDPTLAAPSAPAARNTLPPTPPVLCGREAELAAIQRTLTTGSCPTRAAVAALHGPGGVGKSALAVAVGHACHEWFPDAQLYVDLQGATPGLAPLSVGDVLARILRALGVAPERLPAAEDEAAAMMRAELAGKRVLILADNAASVAQVHLLIPAEPLCAVIVTSRAFLASLDADHLAVAPLSSGAAEAMLGQLVGADRTLAQPDEVASVVRSCSHLPLAIRIAAGRLLARPEWTVAELARRLADRNTALRELTSDDDRLRASFTLTWRELNDGDETDALAARIFLLFGAVLVPDLEITLIAALLGANAAATQAGLDRLVELHLLEPGGRYRPHDVLRLFAAELTAAHPAQTHQHLTRTLRWYDAGSRQASALAGRPAEYRAVPADPTAADPALCDNQRAGQWLDAERSNLVAAVRQGLNETSPLPDLSADVVIGLNPSLLMRCHGQEFELLCQAVLDAGPNRVNDRSVARIATILGRLYRMQARHDEALHCLHQALAIQRDIGDQHGEGTTVEGMALVHVSRGDPHTAIPIFDEALRLHRAVGDLVGEGAALSNAAEAHHRAGSSEVALQLLERSLHIRHRCNDLFGEAITHENMAEVLLHQRRPEDARRHADQALASARRCDARDGQRRTLTLRARIWLAIGNHAQALADCQTALELAAVARPINPADLHELAEAFRAAGDNSAADHIDTQLANLH